MKKNQQIINFLYKQILLQYNRYIMLKKIFEEDENSNILEDEENIFKLFVESYKNFYLKISLNISAKIKEKYIKNISSYSIYDSEYHDNNYKIRTNQIEKYLKKIKNMTYEDAINISYKYISPYIFYKYKKYTYEPFLLK